LHKIEHPLSSKINSPYRYPAVLAVTGQCRTISVSKAPCFRDGHDVHARKLAGQRHRVAPRTSEPLILQLPRVDAPYDICYL
jgi:hypothetical protein